LEFLTIDYWLLLENVGPLLATILLNYEVDLFAQTIVDCLVIPIVFLSVPLEWTKNFG